MKKVDTSPVLISVMLRMLHKFTQCQCADLANWNFDNERDADDLHDLVGAQRAIGWDNLFKGRISTHWQMLQEKYLSRNASTNPRPEYFTPTYWASTLIQQIVYFTLKRLADQK